jgi:hypothetical protein
MRVGNQGKIYKIARNLKRDGDLIPKGTFVIYLGRDERYANDHWVFLPSGEKCSVWLGNLEMVCN